ncbi:baseplate protein [Pseudomonas phage vB_PsaM_M1]|nr:baseplate protein [Pseudomonas phage vB_PsaM_M1]
MAFGVQNKGFITRRLPEIKSSLDAKAVELFQDLVEEGDVVDTSESAILGRLIGLILPSLTDLWEAAQGDYLAFDTNSAVGIPLDNMVALAGITRREETFTVSPLLLAGDNGTFITAGSTVNSSITGEDFNTTIAVGLTPDLASGITVSVVSVADSTDYTITYAGSVNTQSITINSGVSATTASILADLQAEILSAHPTLVSSVVGTTLVIDRVDVFQSVTFSITANLGITKVRKIGEGVAVNSGPISQQANTITSITTPILGWDSVTNPIAATEGRLRETDEELRLRFRNSKFERATNTLDAVYSALIGVTGVEQVIIYENDTDVVDGNGVPAHSFLPIVVGGTSVDIANAIWRNKPIGILSDGNTTVSINDIQGFPHDISFERPNPVVIHINMTLTTDALFPANGEDQIKAAIVQYFTDNFGIGNDVIYSRLFTPINSVPGHQVDALTIGLAPLPVGMANIPIAFNEVASISDVNIVITV